MRRDVLTCDVCDRELPLKGIRGQTVHKVAATWHWLGSRREDWAPSDICAECWAAMVSYARASRVAGAQSSPADVREGT